MFTVLRGGEIFTPETAGNKDILLVGDKIARVGDIDVRALERTDLQVEVLDVSECFVVPGLIDPHEHLLGGSGEDGWSSQTPELALSEIVGGGITTVVGCLGTDTTTKTMPGLLAKAKAFNEEGICAFIYSGGYNVPPVTLTGSVRTDMLLITEVVGAGEIAIADARSTEPSIAELARLVRDAYVGGLLTGKAGVTHFHVGAGSKRLVQLRTLLEEYEVDPTSLYPTHVERSEELLLEAVDLSRRGVTVDLDTVEGDLPRWISLYLERGGDARHVTVSSDAAINSPRAVWQQLVECVLRNGLPFETMLPMVTSNTARVLKLPSKGHLKEGGDGDIVTVDKRSLQIRDVVAGGRLFMRDGERKFREKFLESSNREVELYGDKSKSAAGNRRTA